ncbi:hypothetical protein [Shewanella baltica]|uniref:hypothetical protein n=1 Tax=Shewanella baltica TaxID=62322 RepID=UPI0039AFC0BC
MNLSKNENIALNILLKSSQGLDAFTFFKRLGLSFSDFTKIIESLAHKGIIEEVKNDFFRLTPFGKECTFRQQSLMKNRHWRSVPSRFLGKKLPVGSFYIPSLKLLDKAAFNNEDNQLD